MSHGMPVLSFAVQRREPSTELADFLIVSLAGTLSPVPPYAEALFPSLTMTVLLSGPSCLGGFPRYR